MKHMLWVVLLFPVFTYAQFQDDFSDGNFTSNPPWVGDAGVFIVNGSHQLQLNAIVSGMASLGADNVLSTLNNTEWRFWIRQNFSASSTNYTRIYLVSDQLSFTAPLNGYYLQFGHPGSNDAVELFRQDGATSTSVCRGTDGQIANAFAIGVKVYRDASGVWSLSIDAAGGTNYILEATGSDNTYNTSDFFGLLCNFTPGNIFNFFFDDFFVSANSTHIGTGSLMTISAIQNLFTGNTMDFISGTKIRGVVISDRINNNTSSNKIVLQDHYAGIVIFFYTPHTFNLNDSVEIDLTSSVIELFQGELQINNIYTGAGTLQGAGAITPFETTVDYIVQNHDALESTLIKITDTYLTGGSGIYSGMLQLNDGTGTIDLYTRSAATFAGMSYPITNLCITGYVSEFSVPQIIIRNTGDVLETPIIGGLNEINPSACNTSDGSITLIGLIPFTGYELNYNYNGNPVTGISQFTNSSGDLVVSNLPVGTYSDFTVYTDSACPYTYNISLALQSTGNPSPPAVNASATSGCYGDSIQLTASAPTGTFLWIDPIGNILSDSTHAFINGLTTPGNYCATVSVAGCTSSAACIYISIYVPQTIEASSSEDSVCAGDTIILTATQGFNNYYWSTGNTTNSFSYSLNASDTIILQVIDANGCNGWDTITLTANGGITFPTSLNHELNYFNSSFFNDALCNFSRHFALSTNYIQGLTYEWNVRDFNNNEVDSLIVSPYGNCIDFSPDTVMTDSYFYFYLTAMDTVTGCSYEIIDSILVHSGSDITGPDSIWHHQLNPSGMHSLVYLNNRVSHYRWGYENPLTWESSTLSGEIFQDLLLTQTAFDSLNQNY